MVQSRLSSFYEAMLNTIIGFVLSFTAGFIIYPLCGVEITAGANFAVVLIYTLISIVRSYAVRRWFNARLQRAAQRLAAISE